MDLVLLYLCALLFVYLIMQSWCSLSIWQQFLQIWDKFARVYCNFKKNTLYSAIMLQHTWGNTLNKFWNDFLFIWRLVNITCQLLKRFLLVTVNTKLKPNIWFQLKSKFKCPTLRNYVTYIHFRSLCKYNFLGKIYIYSKQYLYCLIVILIMKH